MNHDIGHDDDGNHDEDHNATEHDDDDDVVPCIHLKQSDSFWHYALTQISNNNP